MTPARFALLAGAAGRFPTPWHYPAAYHDKQRGSAALPYTVTRGGSPGKHVKGLTVLVKGASDKRHPGRVTLPAVGHLGDSLEDHEEPLCYVGV